MILRLIRIAAGIAIFCLGIYALTTVASGINKGEIERSQSTAMPYCIAIRTQIDSGLRLDFGRLVELCCLAAV